MYIGSVRGVEVCFGLNFMCVSFKAREKESERVRKRMSEKERGKRRDRERVCVRERV